MIRGALVMVRVMEGRIRAARGWKRTAIFRCMCGREVMREVRTRSHDCGCGTWTPREVERHGGSNLATYQLWIGMRARCSDTTDPRYGGRGIKVCARWERSFAAFLDDLGVRPFDAASLDRIDNERGYECGNASCGDCGSTRAIGNVRWADATTQGRNKTNNHIVSAFGESLCLAAWSERWGVSPRTIAARLSRGWPAESAVSTP